MTIPNLISASRIVLTPVIMALLLWRQPGGIFAAAVLLVVGGIGDSFDGYLARRFKQVSNFGVFLDLTADKIFVSAVLITLVQLQMLPAWVAAIIVSREFVITGLRLSAASGGLIIPAQGWGKSKTVVTIIALTIIILADDLRVGGPISLFNPFGIISFILNQLGWPLILLATALTILSGITYIVRALPTLATSRAQQGTGDRPSAEGRSPVPCPPTPTSSPVVWLYRKMRGVP
ncbi:MAG: CDP-diacylglycerol--glycerol-3-phosphate 3-phosphatidyltransferase [Dehalococcoidia bacterium]|nr:CDP-diacylglycerol--glycerol-3-phosphate 3-phosphatidyltransferase [Dehalococcoidia bacterium]